MGVEFFWAIPSWIVCIALSTRLRPATSIAGMMVAFIITVVEAHLFSLRQLFTSLEGVAVLIAQIVAGLSLTGVFNPPKPKQGRLSS
jgi:hypothetical protein